MKTFITDCPMCYGSGGDGTGYFPCYACKGTGAAIVINEVVHPMITETIYRDRNTGKFGSARRAILESNNT